jgi:hypothetical protein
MNGVTLRRDWGHFSMTNELPPDESVELAFQLAVNASARDIDYEEFSFEVEGGMDDGVQYKVLVIRI